MVRSNFDLFLIYEWLNQLLVALFMLIDIHCGTTVSDTLHFQVLIIFFALSVSSDNQI